MVIKVNLVKRPTQAKLLPHSLYRGLQARVAARLGVSRSIVSRVASGSKSSKRIKRALMAEARRIERLLRKSEEAA